MLLTHFKETLSVSRIDNVSFSKVFILDRTNRGKIYIFLGIPD